MIKVGLTGNIGSGKTTVCKVFETIGIPVFNADLVARAILEEPAVAGIIGNQFGNSVLTSAGKVSRADLARLVFNDKELLKRLNQIIHPLVGENFDRWASDHNNFPYIIHEAAILVESGIYKNFDKLIVVSAPLWLRIKRVMDRDNVSKSEVMARCSNQLPQDLLEEKADFIIVNDGDVAVLPQVLEINDLLINCSK